MEKSLDFWKEAAPGQSADIMVSTDTMEEVSRWLTSNNIGFGVMVEDVQSLIEETKPRNTSSRGVFDWNDYYPHEDLNALIQARKHTKFV